MNKYSVALSYAGKSELNHIFLESDNFLSALSLVPSLTNVQSVVLTDLGAANTETPPVAESPLDKAKRLIDEFTRAECDTPANFDDLTDVHIAFHTYTNPVGEEFDVQVSVDLVCFCVRTEVDGKIRTVDEYRSLEDLTEERLKSLVFDGLFDIDDYYLLPRECCWRTVYAAEDDITFIMRDHYRDDNYLDDEFVFTEVTGWYYGEPVFEATKLFAYNLGKKKERK